ncbi:Na+/H+ antiporter subunit G [Rubellimicrobium roseum]|uniref:Na+/H+ antiporter subunit G n=1 Tax=Rubellimicrobium roseum TaxID=687525 RepID=A0A5C4N9V3_9RHOB|nr:Na+/H+ antiporter subunit G [Rubellimicrobium roseum]TNC61050.1 Na+/H+ antiporter subunit G [Rubellimicrobium roseum]
MALIAEAVASILIVLGGLFTLIGSWGLVRLPSLMTRLHGPTKATTLGVGGCLLASMVLAGATDDWSGQELLVTLFLFVTAPVSANVIAKAHLHQQRTSPALNREVEERLPPTGTPKGWATFWKPLPDGGPAASGIQKEP